MTGAENIYTGQMNQALIDREKRHNLFSDIGSIFGKKDKED